VERFHDQGERVKRSVAPRVCKRTGGASRVTTLEGEEAIQTGAVLS